MGLLISVLSLLALAALVPFVPRFKGLGTLLALLPLAITVYLVSLLPVDSADAVAVTSIPWATQVGVELAFRADGLSLIFALLIAGIGVLILIYSNAYMHGHRRERAFYSYLLLFTASMLGLVLADDVITLYVFFEMTSISSFLLIGLENEDRLARRAARQALLVTVIGGLALLVAAIMLGDAVATYRLSEVIGLSGDLADAPILLPAAVLVLLAASAKSAQFPFSFWLPNAMIAPTPVSAYLHSAAMVKAGIYIAARFSPVFADVPVWSVALLTIGGLSFVFAAWAALANTEMKRLLAFSTISALGLMLMMLGVGTERAVEACLLYVIVHACYKAALFMTTGSIYHTIHERDVTRVSGLRAAIPLSATAAMLAGVSMVGLPPSLGFVGKELLYEAGLGAGPAGVVVTTALIVGFAAAVAVALLVALRPWVGALRGPHLADRAPGASVRMREKPGLWIPPLLLGAVGLVLGLAPGVLSESILNGGVAAVVRHPVAFELSLWHGLTPELAFSTISVAFGVGVYLIWDRLRGRRPFALLLDAYDLVPQRTAYFPLRVLERLSLLQERHLQTGLVRWYMLVCLAVPLLLAASFVVGNGELALPAWPGDVLPHEWMAAMVVCAGAIGGLVAHSRLTAIVSLTASSYGIALLFLHFGAPDLALTQFLVETLVAVLVVVAFVDMPRLEGEPNQARRLRDVTIAVLMGASMSVVILVALQGQFDPILSDYFTAHSYAEAHARNVVAAVLTDFRALDTLGEIAVLVAAGLGVIVLLRLRPALRAERERREE